MQDGLNTAGAWFGFGVVLDFVSRKCHFFKSPVKNSIVMNGIIGVGAGAITCVKEKFFDSKESVKEHMVWFHVSHGLIILGNFILKNL